MAETTKLIDPATGVPYRAGGAQDSGGNTITAPAPLPAGNDRSGAAGTSSAQLAAANSARRSLNIQNVGTATLGVNEFGGAAAIGTAGTYTLAPGASLNVRTNRMVNVIATAAASPFTATEA